MKRELTVINGGGEKKPPLSNDYKQIINDYFGFIEKQCFNAVKLRLKDHPSKGNPINIENEALELSNSVLDTLQKDNYRVLKEFKGNSRLTTYITAIISRQAIDSIRKKLGRDREKDRAKELGEIGILIYQRIIKDGYPIADAFNELRESHGFTGTREQLEEMIRKIKGKNPGPHLPGTSQPLNGSSVVKNGKTINEDEYVVPDTKSDPQVILIETQRKRKMHEIIRTIITDLNGEERLLLRMRFPTGEDEKPRSVEQVSKVLGITQKAVYKRIDRLLKKCRNTLDREGVSVNELL
jgi:RNA polymerase sigma factor (sigma-70 family)